MPVQIEVFNYSDPSLFQSLQIVPMTMTLGENGLRSDVTYTTRSLRFVATTPAPACLKADFQDTDYASMAIVLSETAKTSHDTFFTVPDIEGAFSLYIKAVDAEGNPLAFAGLVTINLNPGPTGPDAFKLLRLRKYFRQGILRRWKGRNSY